jgi:sialate O-acetylesterase
VKKPVAVRYAFRNFAPGNLGNQANLPLFPFRTDKW